MVTQLEVADVIRKTRSLIEDNGWTQEGHRYKGAFGLIGAIEYATDSRFTVAGQASDIYNGVVNLIYAAVKSKKEKSFFRQQVIHDWDMAKSRTKQEVVDMLLSAENTARTQEHA